jgi:hypothetical protein
MTCWSQRTDFELDLEGSERVVRQEKGKALWEEKLT